MFENGACLEQVNHNENLNTRKFAHTKEGICMLNHGEILSTSTLANIDTKIIKDILFLKKGNFVLFSEIEVLQNYAFVMLFHL